MSMNQIRRTYNVPAKRGGRVLFSGNIGRKPLVGTILGSDGVRLRVPFDGESIRRVLHPTWEVEYLKTPNVRGEPPRAAKE